MKQLPRKCGLTLVLAASNFLFSCRQVNNGNSVHNATDSSVVYRIDTSLFAVIPLDQSIDWVFDKNCKPSSLTQTDLIEIESLLHKCVTDHNNTLSNKDRRFFYIDLAKGQYKRQY